MTTTVSQCDKPAITYKTTPETYLQQIESNLPKGKLWQFDDERTYPKYWRAIAEAFSWFNNSIIAVYDELLPCSSDALLQRHAELWGYPVKCVGNPPNAAKLCEWIKLVSNPCYGNNLWTLKALVNFLGLTYVQKIEEVRALPFLMGRGQTGATRPINRLGSDSSSGCPACCYILITLSPAYFDTVKLFRVGKCCNQLPNKLGWHDKKGLDCIISEYFPVTTPVYIKSSANPSKSILINPPEFC